MHIIFWNPFIVKSTNESIIWLLEESGQISWIISKSSKSDDGLLLFFTIKCHSKYKRTKFRLFELNLDSTLNFSWGYDIPYSFDLSFLNFFGLILKLLVFINKLHFFISLLLFCLHFLLRLVLLNFGNFDFLHFLLCKIGISWCLVLANFTNFVWCHIFQSTKFAAPNWLKSAGWFFARLLLGWLLLLLLLLLIYLNLGLFLYIFNFLWLDIENYIHCLLNSLILCLNKSLFSYSFWESH